nr:hypothetical protein [uncultured Flavobacterium sp.]
MEIPLITYFTPEGNNDYSRIFQIENGFNSKVILYLRENGNPSRGFFIEKETQSDKYSYTQYLESKVVKKGNSLSLKEIEKLILEKQ